MSTMKAQHGHSEACCNIPPVVAEGYKAKGEYEEIDGKKTYVTGPASADKAILFIADIFGFFPQTLQGADILATSDEHHHYRVFIPDWFDGNPASIEWYPPDTPEKQKKLGGFFQEFPPPSVAEKIPPFVQAVQAKFPEIKSWGIIGHCWGGKVVTLAIGKPDSPFRVAAKCHPAMVDPADAEAISIPFMLLASGDEPADKVSGFEANLKTPKHVETFGDQIHGWMGARGDLANSRIKEEYVRGYKTVLEFFGKHWQ